MHCILMQVLDEIRTGRVGALYLMNFSRGSRDEDMIDGRFIMQACRKYHAVIRLPEGIYDLSKESDEDLADFSFLMAKHYKREMNKNMARGQYRRASEGKFPGQRHRFGYRFKYEQVQTPRGPRIMIDWEIDPEESAVAKLIHEQLPKRSTRRLAKILNRLAQWGRIMWFPIKTAKERTRKGQTHREWRQPDIKNIIKNELLIGRVSYATYRAWQYRSGKKDPSRHLKDKPPITLFRPELRVIDDATFERNNSLLRSQGQTPSRVTSSPYAFSGLLKCPECGASLVSNGTRGHRYLCSTYQISGKSVCKGFIVHEIAARDSVVPLMTQLLSQHIGGAIAEARRAKCDDVEINRLKAEIANLDQQIEHLMVFAREGAITPEQLRTQNLGLLADKREKENRLKSLGKEQDTGDAEVFTDEFLANLPEFITYLYEHRKKVFRQVARLMFEGIVLYSPLRGKGVWKRGIKMTHGKHTPRRCTIKQVIYDDRFATWIGSEKSIDSTNCNETPLECRSMPSQRTISSRRW